MTYQPLVSIVIPAYNCALYVEDTFKSILQQSYENWEIIFVNDGSTDNTSEVLKTLVAKQSITIIEQANSKQGKARNNGLRHAKAEWIAFLDADDLWPDNKLRFQLSKTIQAQADLSFTDGYICLNNNMMYREHRFGVADKLYAGDEAISDFHAQNRIPTSSVLAKKSALQAVGGFPENLNVQNCEDYLLWVKMLTKGNILLGLSEPLLFYRVHADSSTSSETNALFPLIEALLEMPGGKTIQRDKHLKEVFKQLVFRLNELGLLEKADVFTSRVLNEVYNGWERVLLQMAWKAGPGVFIRIFWRISGGY